MTPRVIFFHGLESGVGGGKHRFLMQHYQDVVCVDMDMSLLKLHKTNGILRNVLKHSWRALPWNVMGLAVKDSLEGSLAKQLAELEATPRDGGVVVASSWGGAVATVALAKGAWLGPTILIAPAYKTAMRRRASDADGTPDAVYAAIRARFSEPDARILSSQIVIVHGTADDVVPIEDSREFAAKTGIRLIEIDGGDHRMKCLLQGEEPRLKTFIEDVFANSIREHHVAL